MEEYPGAKLIREAESAWAAMYSKPNQGKHNLPHAAMDEEYLVIGGHIDSRLQQKIINFEYIDFARLLPKDCISKIEDQRSELVVRGGNTFFAPVSERETSAISSFLKGEQAFCIYSNILTRAYPGKASELI